MLKALELHGFKSFADKTRFEFPDGITVVVGPNGSGKSNVVDAIRWVLGEQSAKSLRGSEMADVIFKGAGTGQRKPANTAEVTIIFDNVSGQLDFESSEVRVTRRVYRSGEGEYLINDEPCRLRDIRDLFRGTGVGADAYSLIEQGKVDTLLQASPRERRAIFEEAAGISRFKAKKVESQRRLDRVEQNLLRLSDIVEEVDRRLRSLRNQAGKARRYKEYTERLKELRTYVGFVDFRAISSERETVEKKVEELDARLASVTTANAKAESDVAAIDQRLDQINEETRRLEQQLARRRERITGLETTGNLQHKTLLELEREEALSRDRLVAVNNRAGDMRSQLSIALRQLSEAEEAHAKVKSRALEESAAHEDVLARLEQRRVEERAQRQRHEEQIEATTKLTQQLTSLESELGVAADAISRDQRRAEELKRQLDLAIEQATSAESREKEVRQRLDQATSNQDRAQQELDKISADYASVATDLSQCQQQRTAAAERLNVLQEVERRLEGIGAGTKDLLGRARSGSAGPLAEVRGMVADLIEVKIEMAPLVDAALGERAQFIVVDGQRLIRAIASEAVRLRGRVGVVSLSTLSTQRFRVDPQLASEEDVMGRATDFVQVDEPWRELASQLLGTTWFVRSMEAALYLREKYKTAPWRFVTSAGEILEADGTVFGGPRLASGGLVSRRSELRSLQLQLEKLTERENILTVRQKGLQAAKDTTERQLRAGNELRKQTSDDYASVHAQAEAARQLVEQYSNQHRTLQAGIKELQFRREQLHGQQTSVLTGLGELEELVASLEKALGDHHSQLAALDTDRLAKEQAVAETKVDLAMLEQQVVTFRAEAERCEQYNEDRARAVAEIEQQMGQCQARHRDTSWAILGASSELAQIYWESQGLAQELYLLRHEGEKIARKRTESSVSARETREQLNAIQQQRNSLEMQLGELRMKRDAVAERVRDDYGIELAEMEEDPLDAGERAEVEAEIIELRRKVNNIGAVNMESLEELDELEERFGSLTTQYEDLVNAKNALERIIQRINVDSRKMFLETLEIIRNGFQMLFRRAFGGGNADIIVEDDVDILDAGIDIVATPPGKHSLNISLLSGGERALTAVTLLLAIFRHRPSPFCILDEVDGPLDEANIGRFVDVLKEFLSTTKVVIVTHSKKTMSASTTLYGVTMQESGVSKRVSVQFNDVRDDGSIRAYDDDSGDGGDEAA